MTESITSLNPQDLLRAQQILAEREVPSAHAQRVTDVAVSTATGMTPAAIAQLIADARGALGVTVQTDASVLEAADPEHVNALIAAQSDLKTQIDVLTKQRAQITDIFKQLLTNADELQVNGATVVTYKTSAASRVVDTAQVAKLFPDTPENAELWADKPGTRTLLFR